MFAAIKVNPEDASYDRLNEEVLAVATVIADSTDLELNAVAASKGEALLGGAAATRLWEAAMAELTEAGYRIIEVPMEEECLKYVKEREAFGKTLAGFQVTRHKLADMWSRLMASRALTHEVLQRFLAAEAAGVLFTRDPVDGAVRMVVEASWGLGPKAACGASSCA